MCCVAVVLVAPVALYGMVRGFANGPNRTWPQRATAQLSDAQASADCYVGDRSFTGLMFNAGDGKRCLQREVIPAGNEGLLWQ